MRKYDIMRAAMKNSCTRLGVLTLAAIISFAGVCAEAGKCVVTYTFDDGLADQYTVAYPMFRKAGLPATFFIIGSRVGDPNGIRNKAESNTPVMSWDQIRDLSTNGMEIASHGWAHAKYAKMNRDEILEDIRRNQVALKENAGVDCVSFASPFNAKKGADGSDVEALAKEAGLRAMRMRQKGAGGKMTAEQMNALVASAQKKGEWLVFMIHGLARGYDAWENPQELEKHLAWVKEQKDVRVLSFADAASQTGECRGLSVGEVAIPQGANVAPNGDRIEVTSKCLRLNGKAIIPLMGEMHYSRVPRSEWAASLKTMKEGGISIVSTYVFWNHHEWKEGAYDFSGNRDLSAFLEEVHKAGMWAVVRIGPWAHGECREGGFPDWLIDKRGKGNGERGTGGMKLRSCDRQFLAEVEKFWTRLSPEVAPHLWKNGGPVIGVQLENESRGPWPYYQALKALAVKAGYDVPMYTRTGWPRLNGPETTFGEMIPLYGDYAEGFWDRELKSMPGSYKDAFRMRPARTSSVIATEQLGAQKAEDAKGAEKYPYFTCELGGGMASSYHRRLKMEPMDAFALAVVKLGSGSNLPGFYMYHGGTNPTDTGASMAESQRGLFTNWNDLPVVSYEFQSPVSEFGEPQSSYWLIQALGRFCREYGEELAVEDPVFVNEHETRRGRFVFHNDYVRRLNPDGACWIGIEKDGKVERVVDAKTILLVPHPCGASCTCACGENLVYGLSDLKLVKPAGTPPPVALGPAGAAMMPEERAWDMAAEYEVPFKPEANMLEIAYAGDMARLYADGRLVQDDFWKGRPIRYALRRLPRGTKRLTLKVLPWGEGAKEKIFIDSVKRHDVKYRGIFVNDEDWGLRPWAVKHFGKKEQIGVRAYEKIFSLMEKDGLNLIWPAMHEGGYEFSSRPENLELARKHGITVGTSHCEPMLRNNCYLSKEDRQKWSWTANRDFLVDYWKEGVRRGTGNGEWGRGKREE